MATDSLNELGIYERRQFAGGFYVNIRNEVRNVSSSKTGLLIFDPVQQFLTPSAIIGGLHSTRKRWWYTQND